MECKTCKNKQGIGQICGCDGVCDLLCYEPMKRTPTNADRIRAMSDEELAKQLVISLKGVAPCTMWAAPATGKMYMSGEVAAKDMLDWLKQPAGED